MFASQSVSAHGYLEVPPSRALACQKGLNTTGGPAGVANSVNAAVVEATLLLMIVNVAMSQFYLLLFPKASL